MTKREEQERMDRINDLARRVTELMADFGWENDLAQKHLERAKAHLDEAWIDADGQNARPVEKLVEDIREGEALLAAVLAAAVGDKVTAFGRTFTKQSTELCASEAPEKGAA